MEANKEKPEISPDLREVVIRYKGGGYDGCFWEWNFFLVDHEGETWDLHSSGRDGLDSESKRLAFLENPDDEAYVYRIRVKEDIDELNRECTPTHAVGVVSEVNNIYEEHLGKEAPLWVECDDCKDKIHGLYGDDLYPYEIAFVDWHGCGGIASAAGKKICRNCYSESQCHYCGEYDPSEEYDNEEHYCSYCWADHNKPAEGEKTHECTA